VPLFVYGLHVVAQIDKDSEMNAAQYEYDNRFDPRLEGADEEYLWDETEDNKTHLVEQFVTFANFEAFKVAGFENLKWVANLINEPAHSWAVQWVAEEIAQLEGQ
jgi:hypothetical protein